MTNNVEETTAGEHQKIKAWQRVILFNIGAIVIAILDLLWEVYILKNFTWPHAIVLAIAIILSDLYFLIPSLKNNFKTFLELTGIDGASKLFLPIFPTALLVSVWVVGSDVISKTPPVLQFQIVAVSATLGGLVIAGANYGAIELERRLELLRVAQNLISAAVSLIFCVVMFFQIDLLKIDPVKFDWGFYGWVRGFILWSGVILFFGGVSLFTLGIIRLVPAVRNLKNDIKKSIPWIR